MHLIVGLNTGGAETNLHRLICSLDRTKFENVVVCMLPPGPVRDRIEASGFQIFNLGMQRGIPSPAAIGRLARLIRSWKPDILQTWMYHADLLGGVTAKICGGPPVIWNIRNGDSRLSPSKGTRLVARLCAGLSSLLPDRIVSCSTSGRDAHVELGYPQSKIKVIFNGFDTDFYRPDPDAGARLKAELGLDDGAIIILNIGRYHPLKNHAGFLVAAARVRDLYPTARFVMCGDHITWDNRELTSAITRLNLRENVFLLGRRSDVNFLMAAATLLVSSSRSEGFPNVIAEAMACGTVCVATDVGDSREVVGDVGEIVAPDDSEGLADEIVRILAEGDLLRLGQRGRARVVSRFSQEAATEKYQHLYSQTFATRSVKTEV
jgi:glycosyltransferase involved in cell wall biosynthesis